MLRDGVGPLRKNLGCQMACRVLYVMSNWPVCLRQATAEVAVANLALDTSMGIGADSGFCASCRWRL